MSVEVICCREPGANGSSVRYLSPWCGTGAYWKVRVQQRSFGGVSPQVEGIVVAAIAQTCLHQLRHLKHFQQRPILLCSATCTHVIHSFLFKPPLDAHGSAALAGAWWRRDASFQRHTVMVHNIFRHTQRCCLELFSRIHSTRSSIGGLAYSVDVCFGLAA